MEKIFPLALTLILLAHTAFSAEVPTLKRAKDYKANIPVRVIKKVPLPRGYHEGLLFDGKHIWVNNGEKGKTWIVDPDTGEVTSEIEPAGTFTEGITAYGDGTFWVTDWDEKKLYRVTIKDNKMEPEYDISLDPARPTGVVWTGENLYVITWTRGVGGTSYHLMQLGEQEHMFSKLRIKRIYEPTQLAWDGKYLWITSWYSQLVYKVDVNTFKILGSFESPVSDTTGIAWDGKHFWLTGTYSALYQLELLED